MQVLKRHLLCAIRIFWKFPLNIDMAIFHSTLKRCMWTLQGLMIIDKDSSDIVLAALGISSLKDAENTMLGLRIKRYASVFYHPLSHLKGLSHVLYQYLVSLNVA